MSYWPLSDLDPAPGNPDGLRGYGTDLKGRATVLEHLSAQTKTTSSESNGVWIGQASDAFRTTAEIASICFDHAAKSFTKAGAVVITFASALQSAQRELRTWADAGSSAYRARVSAQRELNTLPPDDPSRPALRVLLDKAEHDLQRARINFNHAVAQFELEQRTCINSLHDVIGLSRLVGASASGTARVGGGVAVGGGGGGGGFGAGITGTGYVTDGTPGGDLDPIFGPLVGPIVGPIFGSSKRETTKTGKKKTETITIEVWENGKKVQKKIEVDKHFGADGGTVPKGTKKDPKAAIVLAETDFFNHRTSRGAHGEGAGENGSWSADAGVVAETTGTAKVIADKNGVNAVAEASARAMLEAKAEGEFHTKYVSGGASVHAGVGAHASAKADASLGRDGAHLGVGGDAFVGGELGTEAHLNVAGVETTGGAGVSFGVGVKAHGGGDISMKKIGFHGDVGAAFGLGLNAKVNIEIHPVELAANVGEALANFF
jgi:hypothetical protein